MDTDISFTMDTLPQDITDDEWDGVSLADSVASEPREDSIYQVDDILADRMENGRRMYLTLWTGYPLHRATWEPRDSFDGDPLPLQLYKQKKAKIRAGEEDPFNEWKLERAMDVKRRHAIRKIIRDNGNDRQQARAWYKSWHNISTQKDSAADQQVLPSNLPVQTTLPGLNDLSIAEEEVRNHDDDPPLPPRRRWAQRWAHRSSSSVKLISHKRKRSDSSNDGHKTSPVGNIDPNLPQDYGSIESNTQQKTHDLDLSPKRTQPTAEVEDKGVPENGLLSDANHTTELLGNGRVAVHESVPSLQSRAQKPTTNKTGATLLHNWNKSVKTRRHSLAELHTTHEPGMRQFKTLSERYRVQKYASAERPPNPDDLEFFDDSKNNKSKGRLITSLSKIDCSLPQIQVPLTQGESQPMQPSDSGDIPTLDSHAPGSATQGNILCSTSIIPMNFRSTQEDISSAQEVWSKNTSLTDQNLQEQEYIKSTNEKTHFNSNDPISQGDMVGKVPLTCFHWLRGNCHFTEKECNFRHSEEGTYGTGSENGYIPPKYYASPRTCYFWWYSPQGCVKGEKECSFAHWNTGRVALKHGERDGDNDYVEVDCNDLPVHQRNKTGQKPPENQIDRNNNIYNKVLPPKQVTCYFWHNGGCKNQERSCKYAHAETGVVASLPTLWRDHGDCGESVPAGAKQDESLDSSEAPTLINHMSPPLRKSILPREQTGKESDMPAISTKNQGATFTYSNKATLTIQQQNLQESIGVYLVWLEEKYKKMLADELGAEPELQVDHMCLVDYFQDFCYKQGEMIFRGDILPGPNQTDIVSMLARFLSMRCCGAVIIRDQMIILLYPAQDHAWSFLDAGNVSDQRVKLCLYAQKMVIPAKSIVHSSSPTSALSKIKITPSNDLNCMLGIELDSLFRCPGEKILDKRMFLMYKDTEQPGQSELIARIFQKAGVRIYTANTPGAWEHFKNCSSGVVLVHSDFWAFHKVPDLTTVLQRGSSVNFFRVVWENPSDRQKYAITTQRIFPGGMVIFITDDIWRHHPVAAYEVLEHFYKKDRNDRARLGACSWKLGGRPGLRSWVASLAEKLVRKEKAELIETRLKMIQLLDELVTPELEDPFNPPNPSEDAPLLSVPPEELPRYENMWENDEEEATDFLVDWFGGWACTHVDDFRRFVVVHAVRKNKWSERYQHMLFHTPDELWRGVFRR